MSNIHKPRWFEYINEFRGGIPGGTEKHARWSRLAGPFGACATGGGERGPESAVVERRETADSRDPGPGRAVPVPMSCGSAQAAPGRPSRTAYETGRGSS